MVRERSPARRPRRPHSPRWPAAPPLLDHPPVYAYRSGVVTVLAEIGAGYTPAPATAGGPETAALTAALRALDRPGDAASELVTAPCPGGGLARTAWSANGPGPAASTAALAPLAGSAPLLDHPPVYAYRSGVVTVLAEISPDETRLAATVGCPG
ncbi:hypothetical protein JNW90_22185 [Micromonospora sp. STR1s_5]|nr:hypothetical protein [Micromonospora sp. STR1s_5]